MVEALGGVSDYSTVEPEALNRKENSRNPTEKSIQLFTQYEARIYIV